MCLTWLAFGREVFVDLAVTIVVLSVASLGCSGGSTSTTFHTRAISFADPGAFGFASCAAQTLFSQVGKIFIDLTITVIVFVVASFRGCVVGAAATRTGR